MLPFSAWSIQPPYHGILALNHLIYPSFSIRMHVFLVYRIQSMWSYGPLIGWRLILESGLTFFEVVFPGMPVLLIIWSQRFLLS